MSNLAFLSELLESVVRGQFLNLSDAMPNHQSSCRKRHSTETASLKVFNDLLPAFNRGEVTAAVLLDFSSAFYTVDHELHLLHAPRKQLRVYALL